MGVPNIMRVVLYGPRELMLVKIPGWSTGRRPSGPTRSYSDWAPHSGRITPRRASSSGWSVSRRHFACGATQCES